jgi:hypothetical protein
MTHRAKGPDLDWFEAGWSAFHVPVSPDVYPPLDDRAAQRAWLGGFGAAWAQCPETTRRQGDGCGNGLCRYPVTVALEMALAGRIELLRRLQLHGLAASPCVY